MLVIFYQIYCELNLLAILINNNSIDFDQTSVKINICIFTSNKLKENGGYGTQIFKTEVSVNYTFNIF